MKGIFNKILFVIFGATIGFSGAIYFVAKWSYSERHALFHAYRLGCVESSEKRLSDCSDQAALYQVQMELFLVNVGLPPN